MQIQPSINTGIGFGCSDFQLTARDGTITCARAMDFPIPMDSEAVVFNRNTQFTSTAPDNSPGLSWTSKYGFVGINAFNLNGCDEGMNEAGLSFGFLTLECTEYQTVSDSQKHQALALMDVGTWILGNFETVDEVKEALGSVRIWGGMVEQIHEIPRLHIALHDAAGKNLVIEFIHGEAVVYDNPLGVLTNDPPFDYQINNLEQYNYLSADPAPPVKINGLSLPSLGIGSGMKGLPGDWTPMSRFVRIAAAVRFGLQPQDAKDSVVAASHILNTVDTPKGMVACKLNEERKAYVTTRWSTIKVSSLSRKVFLYRSNEDFTLRKINLKAVNFTEGTKHNRIKIQAARPTIIDVTKQLNAG